jgi:hypothetical protein
MSDSGLLIEHYAGFRERFLDYETLTSQLHAWASAFPHVIRLSSIGQSNEGRELWLLTLGADPDRARPAVWVDGNMHASELCGSSAALAIAEDVIRLHVETGQELHGLPPHMIQRLRDVLFYIVPRISPDGAETVLTSGRYVRSVTRDERGDRSHARWVAEDVNHDGLVLTMRQRDPAGEFIESATVPGWMLPRAIEDSGPFYKIYPEGVIENFDGVSIPEPHFLSDNPTDLNRNFPFSWMPEYEQDGAGEFPLSEPESRAVAAASTKLPHLFAWLNFHTFGGVFIRPLGDKPDSEMDQQDLALFKQIGVWATQYTGYPMVSGFEEFTYQPNKPLHGDMVDYAYHQRGCIAYVCELWDLFQQVGLTAKKPFIDTYMHLHRDDLVRIARWDTTENRGRALSAWRPFEHPQIGTVEIGGLDPRVGIWNPPSEKIAEICTGQSAAFLRVAGLAPDIRVSVDQASLGGALTRIDVTIENHGYLPTYILHSARKLDWNEPLVAQCDTEGCTLDVGAQSRCQVGHLDGWGRGLFHDRAAFHYQRSRGNSYRRQLSWLIRGQGTVTLRVGSPRVGWVTRQIAVAF